MRNLDIVSFGEPLMEFAEVDRQGERLFLPGFGGDTMNLAVAAARQGAHAAVFTAIGDDDFGRRFLDLWDRENIDRSAVLVRTGERTGAYFITYSPNGHEFSYARAHSAASRVTAADIPADLIARSSVLHVSGISQAISDSACDAVFAAMRTARRAGTQVSYDTNLRLRLWPLDRARAIILAALALSDIARPSIEDAQQLTGLTSPNEIIDRLIGLGPKIVALTLGQEGCLVATANERRLVPGLRVEAVDTSGAGDTFGGAFLAEYLRSGDPFRAARYGNVAAALQTRGHGAVAPMPRREEVEAHLSAT